MEPSELQEYLDQLVYIYNREEFIIEDPILIPRSFSKKQDVEIAAFWTATFAWGQRTTIINKARELFKLMDGAPYDFILNHQEQDLRRFENFVHRTFQYPDTLYFIDFFKRHYSKYNSLEDAFLLAGEEELNMESALNSFRTYFFSGDFLKRTQKHVSSPARKSRCKRLNMFMRWMVRDDGIVDLGIWKRITPSKLLIPLDVHVHRSAVALELSHEHKATWKTVKDLTNALKVFCPEDPVKYDYALFGLSRYLGKEIV